MSEVASAMHMVLLLEVEVLFSFASEICRYLCHYKLEDTGRAGRNKGNSLGNLSRKFELRAMFLLACLFDVGV